MKKEWIKNWFSNMLPMDAPYIYQEIAYLTSENYYQAMKLREDQIDSREKFSNMTPQKAKREIRKYDIRPDWNDKMKLEVMERILTFKFVLGTTWADKLLATGDAEIVENNNWKDTYWGYDVLLMKGENHLGKILMKIRNELKLEKALN